MRARAWWTVLVVTCTSVIVAAVWQGVLQPRRPAAAPLPVQGEAPAFRLTDQRGRTVTRETLRGAPWIADFIFTRCGGQCPLMTSRLLAVQRALPVGAPVRFVCISVDPAYDTPEVLARHARAVGADGPRWHWLTGAQEAIFRLSREGFHLGVEAEGGSPEEPIIHSVRLILVDAQGRVRGYYDGTAAGVVERLVRDLARLER